jgi:ADP-ribosylglycohydrolase
MLGAIIGDFIGLPWERIQTKNYDFNIFPKQGKTNFSDDTVLTIAVANSLINHVSYVESFHHFGNKYISRGFGKRFKEWLKNKEIEPYGSWGNGSAMRVSPIVWLKDDLDDILEEAEKSAAVTHNDPQGIKGALCTAHAIHLAFYVRDKEKIKDVLKAYYPFDKTYEQIKPDYQFDVSCQGSVPEAITCFLESKSFMDSIRKAVSLGGDADTQASIAGAIAESYYGLDDLPVDFMNYVYEELPDEFLSVIHQFNEYSKISFPEIELSFSDYSEKSENE